jgi:hypothetical protein
LLGWWLGSLNPAHTTTANADRRVTQPGQCSQPEHWVATADDLAATVTDRYSKRRTDVKANLAAYDWPVQDETTRRMRSAGRVNLTS